MLTVRGCGTTSALNDMAVSLMERGYPDLAVETLTDALQLMQEQTVPRIEDVQAASSRYAEALSQPPQNCFHDLTLEVVDNHDFAALRAVAKGRQMSICFPVSISGSTNDEETADQDSEASQNFGILMYNLGLANLLRAAAAQQAPPTKIENSIEEEHKLLEASLMGLQTAETTFASLMDQQNMSKGESKDNNSPPINHNQEEVEIMSLLLSVLVLNTMSMVFSMLDQPWKSEQSQNVASILCSNIDQESLVRIMIHQRH